MDVIRRFAKAAMGNQYITVMTELFTKWIGVMAISDKRTSMVCKAVMDGIVAKHELLEKLLTDQGACFEWRISSMLAGNWYKEGLKNSLSLSNERFH